MKVLVMAGGSGTRLWPMSRRSLPKQFLNIMENQSLFQLTIKRLLLSCKPEDIIILTNKDYLTLVTKQLDVFENKHDLSSNILLEPVGRNTGPAIAYGVKYLLEKCKSEKDEIVFVSTSDHIIEPQEKFAEYLNVAVNTARADNIVTLGIKPTKPETGYGYIKAGVSIDNLVYKADRFVEKPDLETARLYMSSGNFYWNSGMFCFSIGTILEEFNKHSPEISKSLDLNFEKFLSHFDKMPNISIDYAVMEKSDRVVIIPMDIYWNDVGSWDSLYEYLNKDTNGNVVHGDHILVGSKNNLIIGNEHKIAAIGLEDTIVVSDEDAFLVAKRGTSQEVKTVVESLLMKGDTLATEHPTVFRPWGSFKTIFQGNGFKIKIIEVNPGQTLSLQKHKHRSEHWVVVEGTARVTREAETVVLNKDESIYIPKETLHRVENPRNGPLKIIEVQVGEYLGEDDIVRFKYVTSN